MADYTFIGLSTAIFVFYLLIIFTLFGIKKRVDKKLGASMWFMFFAILFLLVRRIQQIFLEAEIVKAVPYFIDIVTLIFSILFFISVFLFYREVKRLGHSSSYSSESFKNYKQSLSRKIKK